MEDRDISFPEWLEKWAPKDREGSLIMVSTSAGFAQGEYFERLCRAGKPLISLKGRQEYPETIEEALESEHDD